MRTLTRYVAPSLALATTLTLGGCGEDLAGSDPLELRLGGEVRPINCQVFFEDLLARGVFTITVSWDHVLVTQVEAAHIDNGTSSLLPPGNLELTGCLTADRKQN